MIGIEISLPVEGEPGGEPVHRDDPVDLWNLTDEITIDRHDTSATVDSPRSTHSIAPIGRSAPRPGFEDFLE